jgi:methionine-S-sulfoxide reductase
MKAATFAGGCFWCMVKPFDQYDGVEKVVAGYTGGTVTNPTYEEVCEGKTGHVEAVQISFDEKKISYEQLLEIFWRQIDPTDDGGQFTGRGPSYRTAIFYHDSEQKVAAEKSRDSLQMENYIDKPIRTEIFVAGVFYPAEEEHQNYYKKNPQAYAEFYAGSGRKDFVKT